MMTKWDTIQADVSDAYRHLDELEAIDKHNNEVLFDEDMISLDELTEQELTLDWESVE
jgi:predicted DNA binding protein